MPPSALLVALAAAAQAGSTAKHFIVIKRGFSGSTWFTTLLPRIEAKLDEEADKEGDEKAYAERVVLERDRTRQAAPASERRHTHREHNHAEGGTQLHVA